MPPIPFADNFLAGSIISLLFPIGLLIAIAVWYLVGVRRFDGMPRAPSLERRPMPGLSGRCRAAPERLVIEARAEIGSRRPPWRAAHRVLVAAALFGVSRSTSCFTTHPRRMRRHRDGPPLSSRLRGQATWPAGVRPAPAITMLRDQTGRSFSLDSLRGRTVAMTFFDSHCNQACPLEGRAIAAAERALPASRRPVLVVVSVNPRDTPASVRAAARQWGLAQAGSWHWLSGRTALLARAWRAYHIFVKPTEGDIAHTEALYLLDRRGYERSGLPVSLPATVRQPGSDRPVGVRPRACELARAIPAAARLARCGARAPERAGATTCR